MNTKVLELLKENGVDPESVLGKELIKKYEISLSEKQKDLKDLEDKLLTMADDDFLKSIK